MKVIYSEKHIGIDGAYIAPFRFDGIVRGADEVFTDDVMIKDAYEAVGVKVVPITKHKK